MLNFDDLDLVKHKIKDGTLEKNKKIDKEKIHFYNSLYNKNNLSDYILVDKNPKKSKDNTKDKNK